MSPGKKPSKTLQAQVNFLKVDLSPMFFDLLIHCFSPSKEKVERIIREMSNASAAKDYDDDSLRFFGKQLYKKACINLSISPSQACFHITSLSFLMVISVYLKSTEWLLTLTEDSSSCIANYPTNLV